MSDSRDDLLERARDVLLRVGSLAEQIAQRLHQLLVDARPALLKFAEGLRLIEQSPPVPGYEAVLIDRGHHPLAARILAWNLLRLGNELLEEIRAERKLASAILRVVTAGDATPLVISRRARAITAALNDGMAMPALCAAWAKAGISSETAYSIGDLAERAMRRDAAACRRLREVCAALKPHLVDPRGTIPSVASLTHELELSIVDHAYTYDAYNNVFKDPATRATCIAMNIKKFDPRPARRRVRKREKGRG